jgi:hypothetical protein
MFENEKNNFDGYGRYINLSKKKEWLCKDWYDYRKIDRLLINK